MEFYYVYILHNKLKDFIYVGYSKNLTQRFGEHNKGLSKSTRPYVPLELIHYEAYRNMKDATPEDMKKGMDKWMEWAGKCGNGLVDMGTPLGNGQKVTKVGTMPSDKEVIGYSILQAENIDEAVGMLKEHPHLEWAEGCEIEVHESLPIPGM